MLARRMMRSRHGDNVTGDVAKTGDISSLHCRFSAVIKALKAQHEHGFIPVFNYDLRNCVIAYCIPMIMHSILTPSVKHLYQLRVNGIVSVSSDRVHV